MNKLILSLLLATSNLLSFEVIGQYWMESFETPATRSISASPDGSVYFISFETELYKSTDDGYTNSWQQIMGFPAVNQYNIFTNSNTVFMLNSTSITTGYDGKGVFASTDGGDTWESRNSGLQSDTNVISMHRLADGVLMIQTRKDTNTFNLYRSTDNGDTWDFVQDLGRNCISVTTISDTEAYIASATEVFKSTDNGQSWVGLNASTNAGIASIVQSSTGELISGGLFGIEESTDGGTTWVAKSTNGLPQISVGSNYITFFKELRPGIIYLVVNNDEGIYYSDDDGNNWIEITNNIPSTDMNGNAFAMSKSGYLFAAPFDYGVYRSSQPVGDSLASLNENNQSNLSMNIYPNPTAGKVLISSNYDLNDYIIEVKNSEGKLISFEKYKNNDSLILDIQDEKGVYYVRVYNEEYSKVMRIVKQ
ncbi:MAG: T9SS type A sorting domain-containing protein [Brumimicrobium sp.]